MFRIVIILVCLLLVGKNISAKERTWTEKKSIALRTIRTLNAKTRVEDQQLSELFSTSSLTVVGNNEYGFVVVSNDEKRQPVLGYSANPFDKDDIADGMKWWIDAVTEALKTNSNNATSADILHSTRTFSNEITPLIATIWNQNNPYNYLCPNMASKGNYPTGCVATALSQIMNYHKHPSHGKGTFSYVFHPDDGTAYQLTANFEETFYDWDNMLDNYSKNYNDAQRDAVATLMSHVGISVQMAYNPSGSGAYSVEAANALRNYFCYNDNVRLYRREFYSAELWMQMLFTELNYKRPVYYTGVDPNGGGHAFVIDGYNEEGLVHVNWGWGGKSDGYYEIALLNPSGNKFTDGQEMVSNICLPDVASSYISQLASVGFSISLYGSSTKRLSISAKVYDIGADDFEGNVAALLQNEDTTIVAKVQEEVILHPASLGFLQSIDIALRSIDITNIPDGTYRVFLGCMCNKDKQWQLIRPYEGKTNSAILKKAGSAYDFTEESDDMWTTSVAAIKMQVPVTNKIFNLQGRYMGTNLNALPKGIYIIGGKKVVK